MVVGRRIWSASGELLKVLVLSAMPEMREFDWGWLGVLGLYMGMWFISIQTTRA
jgi:uncharacterized membrane protein